MTVRTNRFKQKLLKGEPVFGVIFPFPSIDALDILSSLGFDYIFLEGEHGSLSLNDAQHACITANTGTLMAHAYNSTKAYAGGGTLGYCIPENHHQSVRVPDG
jgi:4-hydroxy-2-oxoheptanedioate aldolase